MTTADIPTNVFISGTGRPLPQIELPPLEEVDPTAAQAQSDGIGIRQTPAGDQAAKPKSLRELIEASPEYRQELEREFLTPTRTSASAAAEATARQRIEFDQLRARQDELADRLLQAKPEQLAGLQTELRQVRTQLQQRQQEESQRAVRERSYAQAAMKEVFGLTDEQLAAMPQMQSSEDIRKWALAQSPVVRSAIQDAMQQAGRDTQTIENAQTAAQFGQRLQRTPAPTAGAGAAETPRNSETFEQKELKYLRGELSFEEYAKARATNPRLGVRI